MGLDDLVGKAKEQLSEHGEQAKDALEKARDAVKAKTDDTVDPVVDKVVDAAMGFVDKNDKK